MYLLTQNSILQCHNNYRKLQQRFKRKYIKLLLNEINLLQCNGYYVNLK